MECGYCRYQNPSEAMVLTHRAANHDTSRPPVVRVRFLYAQGQRVHIGQDANTVYTVRQRRYVEREVMPPYCEYEVGGAWEVEADLWPVKE